MSKPISLAFLFQCFLISCFAQNIPLVEWSMFPSDKYKVITPLESNLAIGWVEYESKEERLGQYIDFDGKPVIEDMFLDAKRFSEELAAVNKNGKYGYINRKGEVIIPFLYQEASPFKNGLALVRKNGLYGYINKNGDFQFTFYDYSFVCGFDREGQNDSLIVAQSDGKYGFIQRSGEVVLDFIYDEAKPFKEGLAAVKMGKHWTYINKIGNEVFNNKEKFRMASSFCDGMARVELELEADVTEEERRNNYYLYKERYINKQGKILNKAFSSLNDFSEGRACVSIGDVKKRISGAGYTSFGNISNERVIIDKQGNILIHEKMPSNKDGFRPGFLNGVGVYNVSAYKFGGLQGLMDIDGNRLYSGEFDRIIFSANGLITVHLDSKIGVVKNPLEQKTTKISVEIDNENFSSSKPGNYRINLFDRDSKKYVEKSIDQKSISLIFKNLPSGFNSISSISNDGESQNLSTLKKEITSKEEFKIWVPLKNGRNRIHVSVDNKYSALVSLALSTPKQDTEIQWDSLDAPFKELSIKSSWELINAIPNYNFEIEKGFIVTDFGRSIYNMQGVKINGAFSSLGKVLNENLVSLKNKGEYKLVDRNGKNVLDFPIDIVEDISRETYLKIGYQGKYGIIDEFGELVIPMEYDDFRPSSFRPKETQNALDIPFKPYRYYSVARAKKPKAEYTSFLKDNLFGLKDSFGIEIIKPTYENSLVYSEGLIAAKKNDLWGFIDINENIVIDFQYGTAKPFNQGLAIVSYDKEPKSRRGEDDKLVKYLIVNKSNERVTKAELHGVYSYFEGQYVFKFEGKYGVMDSKGEVIAKPIYDKFIYRMTSGTQNKYHYFVSKDGKKGLIDQEGIEVVACEYDEITVYSKYKKRNENTRRDTIFSQDDIRVIVAEQDNKKYIFDKKGKLIINDYFDKVGRNRYHNVLTLQKGNLGSCLDADNKIVLKADTYPILTCQKEYACYKIDRKDRERTCFFYNEDIADPKNQYQDIGKPKESNVQIFKKEGKYGLWDESRNEIIPPTYAGMKFLNVERTMLKVVNDEKKVGIINAKNEQLVPIKFTKIKKVDEENYLIKLDKTLAIFNYTK